MHSTQSTTAIYKKKLNNYGFRDKSFEFFSSYISNRSQVVTIGDITSSERTLRTGVPQGSVLGPLFFILYVNDLPLAINSAEILMYADDAALIVTGESMQEIEIKTNDELANISNWFMSNKLTVNVKKTKYMIIHSRHKSINLDSIQIKINNLALESTTSFKYLGVVIDNYLHWQANINSVCSRVSSGCHALLQIRDYFDEEILRILYFSLVHCHLSYCIDSWGWTYTTYLEPLRKLQKRSIRIITHSSHDHPSAPLFHKLQILPIDSLRQQKTAIAMNNVIRYNRPLNSYILCSSSRPTKNVLAGNYNLPPTNNVYGDRRLQFIGAKIWNNLPQEIKSAFNFPHQIKEHFLSLLKEPP